MSAYVIEAIAGKIIPALLPFIVQSDMFFDWAVKNSAGGLSPRVKWKSLAEFEFPLPPLERQKAILKVLGKIDDVMQKSNDSLDIITKAKNVASVHFYNFKKNDHVQVKKLGDLCVKIQDGTHFSPQISNQGFKYITSKNIKFGYLDLTNIEHISLSEHQKIYKRCDVQKGDILLTKDGANTGNVCINPLGEEFSLLSSVAFIRHKGGIDKRYLFHYFLSPICQREIKNSMSGNAITRLTLTKIKAMKIPLCLVEEQKDIGKIFDLFSKCEQVIFKKINSLRHTRQIMTHHFLELNYDL